VSWIKSEMDGRTVKLKPDQTLELLGKMLYAIGLAVAIDDAPFHFNPHRLKYTHYRCVKCWSPAGTRKVCECQ
jgi:hypothetical protein